jgi:hypothetical protein
MILPPAFVELESAADQDIRIGKLMLPMPNERIRASNAKRPNSARLV